MKIFCYVVIGISCVLILAGVLAGLSISNNDSLRNINFSADELVYKDLCLDKILFCHYDNN